MSKKQWSLIAAVVLVIVAALCIFYMPREAERVLDLGEKTPTGAYAYVTRGAEDSVKYVASNAQEVAQMEAQLKGMKLRYLNSSSIYTVRSGEDARVIVTYEDGSWKKFTFAVSGEVRCNDKNYQAIDAGPLEALMAQIKSWENASVLTTCIWGEVSLGPLDQQSFRTQDADQIAKAMALLKGLQARRTFDDDTVSVRNDAYNAQMTLTYAGSEAEIWFGEWGWLRYEEENYMAEDPAVTKELMELVKDWIITE